MGISTKYPPPFCWSFFVLIGFAGSAVATPLTLAGQPAVLKARAAGDSSVQTTLKPESFKPEFPEGPVLPE